MNGQQQEEGGYVGWALTDTGWTALVEGPDLFGCANRLAAAAAGSPETWVGRRGTRPDDAAAVLPAEVRDAVPRVQLREGKK